MALVGCWRSMKSWLKIIVVVDRGEGKNMNSVLEVFLPRPTCMTSPRRAICFSKMETPRIMSSREIKQTAPSST